MIVSLESFSRGANARLATIGRIRVWFSYSTPIALSVDGAAPLVRDNEWGPTTGRHMSDVEGANEARVNGDTFMSVVRSVLRGCNAPSVEMLSRGLNE